ncbi:hypothetical protein MMC13_005544 [Lambiella insularis]|nr:hypothetical protein [Lambiella insularis]
MLEWLTGASRSYEAPGLGDATDRSSVNEPPETPAPLFAVRAFKSALFGTPVPSQDEEERTLQIQVEEKTTEPTEVRGDGRTSSSGNFTSTTTRDALLKPKVDLFSSPAKGILLTPGTAATRRKTVSFGALADLSKDLLDSNSTAKQTSSLADNASTRKPVRSLQKTRRREAGLRRTLFEAPGKNTEAAKVQAESQSGIKAGTVQLTENEDLGDITTDLKHPLSKSGQHWKKEYHKDHEKSKTEMRKLIQYSQVAKSYALKRDAEAMELSEKLQRAMERMIEMEARVSQLASQLRDSSGELSKAPPDQADLLSELATQTANALRYKQKAEKYRVAIQQEQWNAELDKTGSDIPDLAQAAQWPCTSQEQHPAQAQPAVSASMVNEIEQLREAAEVAEGHATTLERDNMALKNTLARIKQEMNAYEIRHRAREDRRKRKDEKAEAQIIALREELMKYKSIHGRENNMPVSSAQTCDSNSQSMVPKARTLKQQTVTDNLNLQYQQSASPGELQQIEDTGKPLSSRSETEIKRKGGPGGTAKSANVDDLRNSLLHESIDIWTAPSKDIRSRAHTGSDCRHMEQETSIRFSDKSPLAELKQILINGRTHGDSEPPTPKGNLEADRRIDRALTDDMNSAAFALSFKGPNIQRERTVETQEPQPVAPQLARGEALSQGFSQGVFQAPTRANTLARILGDSRASSLSGRPPLPPDRVKAAKRRLEQKNAEIAKAQISGKENRRPR